MLVNFVADMVKLSLLIACAYLLLVAGRETGPRQRRVRSVPRFRRASRAG